MASRRSAVRARSSGPGVGRRAAGMFAVAWRPFLVWVLPSAVLIAFCAGGLYLCRAHVMTSAKYLVVAPKLALAEPLPRWWEKEFEDQINQSCAFAGGSSTLDGELLEKIAAAYRQCPWVKNIRWVRKRFPNRIEASIDIRWPRAAVALRTGRGIRYYLVGEDAVRLPKAYETWPRRDLNVPYIAGTRTAPPEPGEPWPDASVAAAIEIVELLKRSDVICRSINITAVDVSNYRGREDRAKSEFLVFAENNCVIEWGRAPSTARPGELPVKEKIAKLERFLSEGNPTSNRTLDLRFAGRVVVSRRYGTDGDSS